MTTMIRSEKCMKNWKPDKAIKKEILFMEIKKNEEFADLIEENTHVKWKEIKRKLPEMPTKDIIELMPKLGLYVNKTIALEISKRNDAVFWLRRHVQNQWNWKNAWWSAFYAAPILARIKSKESLELLLDMIRYQNEDIGDRLTEDMPGMLVAFGENCIPRLKEFTLDETLEPISRGTAVTALSVLAKKYPVHEKEIKGHLMMLLNTIKDRLFATVVLYELETFYDISLLPDMQKAVEEGKIDDEKKTIENVEAAVKGEYAEIDRKEYKQHTTDPIEHFSRRNVEYWHNHIFEQEINENDEKRRKTGRNDPCPCGSGKKYKKCCGVGA